MAIATTARSQEQVRRSLRYAEIEEHVRLTTGVGAKATDLFGACLDCNRVSSFARAIVIGVGDEIVYGCPDAACAGWLARFSRTAQAGLVLRTPSRIWSAHSDSRRSA